MISKRYVSHFQLIPRLEGLVVITRLWFGKIKRAVVLFLLLSHIGVGQRVAAQQHLSKPLY